MIASITALLLSVFALTRSRKGAELLAFLDFYVGVFALVTLTLTVALGLLASERVFLPAAGRVRAQFAHRAAAAAGMVFLAVHVIMKLGSPAGLYVQLGVVAAALMAAVAVSGLLRGRFAGTARPWLWRVMHGASYLAWPLSILHGLTAGRTPAGWVAWSYVACLAAVGAALLVRAWAELMRPPAVPENVEAPEAGAAAEPAPAADPVIDMARYRRAG